MTERAAFTNDKQVFYPARLRIADDTLRRLLFFLMLMTIGRLHQHFSFLNPLRPALLVVGLAGLYAISNPQKLASGSIFRTWPAKVIAALGIMACLSVPFGISMGGSASFILQDYSKVLIFAFLLIAATRNAEDLYTFVWGFVNSVGFLAYLSLFVFRMQRATADGLVRIAQGYSYDANDIGVVMLIGLPLCLLLFHISSGKGRIYLLILLAGIGATLAKTGSRGGFVGLLAVGGALLVMLKQIPMAKKLGFIAVTTLGLAVTAPAGYWEQMNTLFSPGDDYNLTSPTGRKAIWTRAIGYMIDYPIFGLGVENFPRAEGTISDRAAAHAADPSTAGVRWNAAHNSFLQAGAEMGIPGLVLFSSLVFGGINTLLKLRRSIPPGWQSGTPEERFLFYTGLYLPVSFIGFAVAGAFVSFAYLDPLYVLAAFVVGFMVSLDLRLKQVSGGPRQPATEPPPTAIQGPRRFRGGLPPVGEREGVPLPDLRRGPS